MSSCLSTSAHAARSTASHVPSRLYRHALTALCVLSAVSCASHRQTTKATTQLQQTTRHEAGVTLRVPGVSLQSDTTEMPLTLTALDMLPCDAEYNVTHDGVTATIKRNRDSTLTLRCVSLSQKQDITAAISYADYDNSSLTAEAADEHPPDNTHNRMMTVLCAAASIALLTLLVMIIVKNKKINT